MAAVNSIYEFIRHFLIDLFAELHYDGVVVSTSNMESEHGQSAAGNVDPC
jgi:hypothetical protein